MSKKTLQHKPVNYIYLFFLLCESTEEAVAKKKDTEGLLSLIITAFSNEFKERGAGIQL